MAKIGKTDGVPHRIRVKPRRNNPRGGAHSARTDSEAMLTIGDVCAALKNRGGFTGNYDDLPVHTNSFSGKQPTPAYRPRAASAAFTVRTG